MKEQTNGDGAQDHLGISMKPHDGKLVIEFERPVAFLLFEPRFARTFATAILVNADAAENPKPQPGAIELPPARQS